MWRLLLFASFSMATLAFRLQDAEPALAADERSHAGSVVLADHAVPLLVERELWASGVDWNHYPGCAGPNSRVWRWTQQTVLTFKAWLDKAQNPRECSRGGFAVSYVRKPSWGLTSRVRDYEDVLLMNMLGNVMTLYHNPSYNANQCFYTPPATLEKTDINSASGLPFLSHIVEANGSRPCYSDPFMNCVFQPLSRCQGQVVASGQPVQQLRNLNVYSFDLFRDRVDSWWQHLKDAGLQKQFARHLGPNVTRTGKRVREDAGIVRLGILRALLASVTFQPSALVSRQIEQLERSLTRPEGPMLVVQVRRTDKFTEEGNKPYDTRNGQDLLAIKALIQLAEASAGWNYTSFYLISDDPSVFTGARMALLRGAFAARPAALYNPYVQRKYSVDARWRTEGHKVLRDHTQNDIEMVADIFYAAKHGAHLIGCGRSGISQLIAQELGAKFMMDPNALALFEDDSVLLTRLLGAAEAASHLAFMKGLPQEDFF